MKQILILIVSFLFLLFISCGDNHQAAEQHLSNARIYLLQEDFEKAKAEIDSININYPRSFDQRRASIPLLDSIKKATNNSIIADISIQLAEQEPILEALKRDFMFQKDAKYQDAGSYIVKTIAGSGALSYTTLKPGVEEDGRIFLESIYIGGQKHNKVKVEANGQTLESLVVSQEGYIHRFKDSGSSYELIKLVGNYENGLSEFISKNAKSTVKVHLIGNKNMTYILPQNMKIAITKSHELSTQILLIDSLNTVRELAQYKNFYLDNNKQTEVPIEVIE